MRSNEARNLSIDEVFTGWLLTSLINILRGVLLKRLKHGGAAAVLSFFAIISRHALEQSSSHSLFV